MRRSGAAGLMCCHLSVKETAEVEHAKRGKNHVDCDVQDREKEERLEHIVHLLGRGLFRSRVRGHDDSAAGGKRADGSREGGGGDGGDQLDVACSVELGGDISSDRVKGRHDDAGGGAYP